MEGPPQNRGNGCGHTLRYQPARQPSLTTDIATPAPSEPATDAFCFADTGCHVHGYHLRFVYTAILIYPSSLGLRPSMRSSRQEIGSASWRERVCQYV